MLGKQSILFSDTPFSLVEGIHRLKSFEDLPDTLKLFKDSINNMKSCAAYIEAVKTLGYPVSMKLLMNMGDDILRGKKDIDQEYQTNLDNLERLFIDGYNHYKNK